MPLLNDYSEEDDQLQSGGGSLGSSGGGSARQAQASPQQEQQFVPWSRFVSANEDVSKREAGKLQSGVQSDVNATTSARDKAAQQQASDVRSNYQQTPQQAAPAFGSVDAKPTTTQTAGSSFGGRDLTAAIAPAPAPAQAQQPLKGTVYEPQTQPQAVEPVQKTGANVGRYDLPYSLGAIDPNRLQTDTSTGVPITKGSGITGAKSLEAQLGPQAWQSLVGDTMHAGQEAGALGSEAGVGGLLQQRGGAPQSAFDAALVSGAGGHGFRDLSKQYGGNQLGNQLAAANQGAMGRWSKLVGDIDTAAKSRDATINAANQQQIGGAPGANENAGGSGAPGADAGSGWHPEGFSDLNSFLHPDTKDASTFDQYMHEAGQQFSPLDWATRAAGELGYSGQNASELFGSNFSGGALNSDWATANVRTALGQMQQEYGNDAASYLWNHMTPDMWKEYMNAGNSGNMSRLMRGWLESAGFHKTAESGGGGNRDQHETTQAGGGGGAAAVAKEQGTSEDDEAARNQLAMGYSYTDPSGHVWHSVAEWDAAHKK